jgi:Tol biopolymer transport system component
MTCSPRRYPIRHLMPVCTALALACGDGPVEPSTGDLRLVVTTSGADPDPDGYLVTLDGGFPHVVGPATDTTVSGLPSGAHQLLVSGVASNCTLAGDNPRTVQIQSSHSTDAPITINCVAQLGSLRVDVTTTGLDVDPDGYQVMVGGSVSGTVASSASVILDVHAGARTVALAGVAPNCAVVVPRSREVTVAFAETTPVVFQVFCALASGETAKQILLGDGRIIRVQSDGSGATFLTSDQVYADDPAWSPERSRILYEQNPLPLDVFDSRIWGILSPGATPVQITDVVSDGDPSWSPDGSRVVIRNLGDTTGLVVLSPDGSNRVRITDGRQDEAPAWSPDGTRIAFSRFGGELEGLCVVHPDGSGLERLPTGVFAPFSASWSPDGTRIAFTGAEDGMTIGLYIINDDGSGRTRLTPANDMSVFGVSWSPTGDRLALTGVRGAERGLYTIRPDGSELVFRCATQETSVAWAH